MNQLAAKLLVWLPTSLVVARRAPPQFSLSKTQRYSRKSDLTKILDGFYLPSNSDPTTPSVNRRMPKNKAAAGQGDVGRRAKRKGVVL